MSALTLRFARLPHDDLAASLTISGLDASNVVEAPAGVA